jgi:hypothetical protein
MMQIYSTVTIPPHYACKEEAIFTVITVRNSNLTYNGYITSVCFSAPVYMLSRKIFFYSGEEFYISSKPSGHITRRLFWMLDWLQPWDQHSSVLHQIRTRSRVSLQYHGNCRTVTEACSVYNVQLWPLLRLLLCVWKCVIISLFCGINKLWI